MSQKQQVTLCCVYFFFFYFSDKIYLWHAKNVVTGAQAEKSQQTDSAVSVCCVSLLPNIDHHDHTVPDQVRLQEQNLWVNWTRLFC